MGAIAGALWKMLSDEIDEARAVADSAAKASADLRLEMVREYVRNDALEKAIASGVRPLGVQLAFQGRLLVELARRGGVNTAAIAVEDSVGG